MRYILWVLLTVVFWFGSITNIAKAADPSKTLWIDCSAGKLVNWQCTVSYNDLIGKKSEAGDSLSDPVQFLQDIFLTATMFISVLCSIWLIYSWYLYVMWWYDSKKVDQAKKWFSYSLIWLLITIFSVVIVRLAQYFATWNFPWWGNGW